ncbi:DUF1236 domain-containing protein [soil metagenome]
MNKRLLMRVAAAALIAGTGLARAQNPGMSREAPAAGAAKSAPSAAPSADRAAPAERATPVNKDEATDTMNRPAADSGMKATQSDDKVKRDDSHRATDTTHDGAKPSSAQANDSKADAKAGKDMKADSRSGNQPDSKAAADSKSPTTIGQAGAGAKLSTEQRAKITTTIRQQNIKPVTHVNFSISIGSRVPRDVEFHPLPTEIITVYPDWRGYDFILVNDQIIVINPRSYEIVAVIDA